MKKLLLVFLILILVLILWDGYLGYFHPGRTLTPGMRRPFFRLCPISPKGILQGINENLNLSHSWDIRIGPLFVVLSVFLLFFIYIYVLVYVFRDSQKRGLSRLESWFWVIFIGFFTHLIGFIIYLIVRPKMRCQFCGAYLRGDFAVCPYCQRQRRGPPPPEQVERDLHLCPTCRRRVSPDFVICPYCGLRLK